MTDLSRFVMFGKLPTPADDAAMVAEYLSRPPLQDRPQHPELLADEITETEVEVASGGWLDLRIFWSADWSELNGAYSFIAGELDGVLLTKVETAALVGAATLDRWAGEWEPGMSTDDMIREWGTH